MWVINLVIGIPIAAAIFLFGWLAGFNESLDMTNWGTGFDDGWNAHKELSEIKKED